MIHNNINNILRLKEQRFKEDFIQNVNIIDFIQEERNWIQKNLNFIYSYKQGEITFKIHPFCRFIDIDSTSEGNLCKEKYIILPKYLSLGHLHIHARKIDKADKMICIMANYKCQFTLSEISAVILSNFDIEKKEFIEKRLNTMIRKFLSYQYLAIV